MQVSHIRREVLNRLQTSAIFVVAITAGVVMGLALSPYAGSAAPFPGTGATETEAGADLTQSDSSDSYLTDCEEPGTGDRAASPQPENVIPGITDVLNAELGPWWLDSEPEVSHPERPFPVGPYK